METADPHLEIGFRRAFACVLGLLVIALGLLSWNMVRLETANSWVTHTQEVAQHLSELEASLTQVETAGRGYGLSGNEIFLVPLQQNEARAQTSMGQLQRMLSDSAVQTERLKKLRPLAERKMQFNDQLIVLRRSKGLAASADYLSTGAGFQMMAEIRSLLEQMKGHEDQLLEMRAADAERSQHWVYTVAGVCALLLLGAAASFIALIRRDVHRRRKEEEAVRALNQKLEVSNREFQEFAMIASHDLQEPLRKIQMFGDKLNRKYGELLGEEGGDYLERMRTAAARGQALIQGLLAFSRVTTKAQPHVPVDLERTAREVVLDLEGRIVDVGGTVDLGPLPTVDADPLQMRQLLQNLIGNALKFRRPEEPPVVRVHAEPSNTPSGADCWTVEVEDNGIGFDEKYLDRIFKLFQRLHERGAYEGSGMGLAICKKIVERHGGEITARSTPGKGTRFLINLPAHSAA
jgi:signal transduction histidine kinase